MLDRRTVPLLLLTLLTGCVVERPPRVVANPYPAPPPLPPEPPRPRPPVSEAEVIWRPAHWEWRGGSYVLEPGRWVTRGAHGVNWLPGHWIDAGGVWTWESGHWV